MVFQASVLAFASPERPSSSSALVESGLARPPWPSSSAPAGLSRSSNEGVGLDLDHSPDPGPDPCPGLDLFGSGGPVGLCSLVELIASGRSAGAGTPAAGFGGENSPDPGFSPPRSTPHGSSSPPELDISPPDTGNAPPAAGTDPPEAGTAPPEAGTAPPEAGTSPPGAGTALPEAGTSRTALAEAPLGLPPPEAPCPVDTEALELDGGEAVGRALSCLANDLASSTMASRWDSRMLSMAEKSSQIRMSLL